MSLLFVSGVADASNMYVEGMGSYGSYSDANSMPGGVFGLGCSINDNINFYGQGFYGTMSSKSADVTTKESTISGFMGVIEYTYLPISSVPVLLSASAGFGMAFVDIGTRSVLTDNMEKLSDQSPYAGVWLGGKYIFTQHIMITASVGYVDAFYLRGNLLNKSVMGPQFLMGVTFTLGGVNSAIEEGF